ncbi:hypothetical protein HY495_03300 [Candidatus Woesearchaeota archaeon]|nr:hypothetical protein [Candidatus Woesearchaeota archaeon]
MKVKKMVKRLFAVGTGVAMLGATAMGALAADLKDYPSMFVTDGKFNGLLVVGDTASSVDNLALTDIAANMKYKKADAAATTTTTVTGDAWLVGTASKKLEMANTNSTTPTGEQIYDIEQFIGKTELAALADGTYSTTGTSSSYTQYLYFDVKNDNTNEIVRYVENDFDVTADFLYVKSGANIGEYVVEFSSAPESTIQDTTGATCSSGTVLDDYENTKLTMLGKEYTVVLARRPQSTPEDSIKLTLMGGAASGSLLESDSTSVSVGDKSYDVALSYVDTTYAKFTVNGEQSDKLQVGDTFKLADGNEVGVSEILYQNYAGGVHSADFFLGASKVELRDNDITTLATGENSLKVGTETIDGADVNIEGTDDNTTFTLSKIRVNMTAQDDYFVGAGKKLSDAVVEQGDEKELVFSNNWDLLYNGLADVAAHDIRLKSSTDRKYSLVWYDGDNNKVDMPFAFANSSTSLLLADAADEKEVILNEALNISKNDYFVVSAGTASAGTAKSFALQYKGADKSTATSPKISFKNLGSGETLDYSIDTGATSTVATIKLGGYSFAIKNITTSGKTVNDFVINVDLNGDGTLADDAVTSAEVDIVDYYGMTMDFGNVLYLNGTAAAGELGDNVHQLHQPLEPSGGEVKRILMNWTTENTNDYDTQAPARLEFNITATTTNEVTLNLFEVGDVSDPSLTPEGEENVGYGYTTMGAKWTYESPTSSPKQFTYNYPENQRLPQVYVTSGAVASSSSTTGDLTAVDVGVATKLASEVADAWAQNLLVVGGPCVNSVAAELMGNPADCTAGFTPGKAVVKLYEKNGKVAMLVAGYSGEDTRLAGKVVAQQPAKLMGAEVEVSGTSLSDVKVGAPMSNQ